MFIIELMAEEEVCLINYLIFSHAALINKLTLLKQTEKYYPSY